MEFIARVCVGRGADTWLFYFDWIVKCAGLRLGIGETVSKLVRQCWCVVALGVTEVGRRISVRWLREEGM
jgi:hypothetical protein